MRADRGNTAPADMEEVWVWNARKCNLHHYVHNTGQAKGKRFWLHQQLGMHAPSIVAIFEVETSVKQFRRFQGLMRSLGYEFILWPGPIVRHEEEGSSKEPIFVNSTVAGYRKDQVRLVASTQLEERCSALVYRFIGELQIRRLIFIHGLHASDTDQADAVFNDQLQAAL